MDFLPLFSKLVKDVQLYLLSTFNPYDLIKLSVSCKYYNGLINLDKDSNEKIWKVIALRDRCEESYQYRNNNTTGQEIVEWKRFCFQFYWVLREDQSPNTWLIENGGRSLSKVLPVQNWGGVRAFPEIFDGQYFEG
jgi:hypothetical protein